MARPGYSINVCKWIKITLKTFFRAFQILLSSLEGQPWLQHPSNKHTPLWKLLPQPSLSLSHPKPQAYQRARSTHILEVSLPRITKRPYFPCFSVKALLISKVLLSGSTLVKTALIFSVGSMPSPPPWLEPSVGLSALKPPAGTSTARHRMVCQKMWYYCLIWVIEV